MWGKRAKPTRPLPTPNKSLLAEARDDVPWRVAYLLLLIRWAPTRQHEVNALCMRPARIPHRIVKDTDTESLRGTSSTLNYVPPSNVLVPKRVALHRVLSFPLDQKVKRWSAEQIVAPTKERDVATVA